MKKITNYDFDIFDLRESTNENELIIVVSHILAKESLFDMLPINNEKFMNFIHKIQDTYTNITYHNKTHGADLAQTFYFISTTGDMKKQLELDDWDMLSYIIAGACHDVGHPGFSNVYLIERNDPIAIRYNDISVLENFHVATTFEILNNEKYNIFSELTKTEYKRVRK